MSELAYNINGEGFELPETATGWRVRRMKPRGAPEVVYGKDGLPLTISIESDLEELRQSVDTAGRFRLDAVDDRGRNVDGAQPAYVVVANKGSTAIETFQAPRTETADSAIVEAMRLNTELAKSVIDRFPEMMTAAAELLRAADGAGLPARTPRVIEPDDDDDDEDDDIDDVIVPSSPGFELINSLVAQVVPMIITSMAGKKMPKLAAILDWRKAQSPTETDTKEPASSTDEIEATTELPPLDPKMMGHLIAIQSALAPAEAALARQLVAELSPAEMRAWMQELSPLSIPDAIAKVRSILGSKKAGGAS